MVYGWQMMPKSLVHKGFKLNDIRGFFIRLFFINRHILNTQTFINKNDFSENLRLNIYLLPLVIARTLLYVIEVLKSSIVNCIRSSNRYLDIACNTFPIAF